MIPKDKYSKVIEVLKKNEPELSDKQGLTDKIMSRIQAMPERNSLAKRLDDLLFGWINSVGLRLAMATITIFLIGFFVVQQTLIQNRLNSLEKQLVKTTSTINGQKPEPGVIQKVMLKMVIKNRIKEDSITISKDDMNELLDNYRQLLENYKGADPGSGIESGNRESIWKNIDEIPGGNHSNL